MTAAFQLVNANTGTDASAEGVITGISDGNIMVAFLTHSSSSATISTPPSDTWDVVEADPNPADFSLLCYKRVKQSGDSAPTWTWSAAGNWTVDIIAYSGQDTTTSLDDTSSAQVAAANTITTASVTPAVADCLLVAFGAVDASGGARTWTQSSSPTERLDQVNNQIHRCIAEWVISGSGSPITRDLTVTGSAQDLGAFAVLIRPAAGTQYNQSVSGGITPSGTLLRDGRKVLMGGITPSGTNEKQTSKILEGALSSIVGTLTKQTNKVLSGALFSIVGTLTAIKIALIELTGGITPSGTLTKQGQKVLSGGNIPTGALTKQTNKTLSGDITSIVGTLAKQTNKVLSGALSLITGTLTAIKIALQSVSGGITLTGALTKQANKILLGGGAPGGTLSRLTQKVLAGGIIPSGVMARLTSKGLSGIIASIVGTLTSIFQSGSGAAFNFSEPRVAFESAHKTQFEDEKTTRLESTHKTRFEDDKTTEFENPKRLNIQ